MCVLCFFLLFYQKKPWFSIASSRLINLWVVQRFIKDGTLYAVWVMWMCTSYHTDPPRTCSWVIQGWSSPSQPWRQREQTSQNSCRKACLWFSWIFRATFWRVWFWEVVKCWRRSITVVTWKTGRVQTAFNAKWNPRTRGTMWDSETLASSKTCGPSGLTSPEPPEHRSVIVGSALWQLRTTFSQESRSFNIYNLYSLYS